VIVSEHGYELETIISQQATIYFQKNMHNLNWSLALNRSEDAKRKISELEGFLRQGWKIRDIDINAWASPEGEESFNQGLSERRSQTGLRHAKDMLRKLVRERNSLLKISDIEKDIRFNTRAHGEDWEGFMKAVQASDIADKNVITNVVNSQPDVKKREQEIRNMTIVYREIEEEILPPLRRVEISVNTFEPKKTDEEIAQLATTDPSQLNEKELLYAATLTVDSDVQLNIYRAAINQYPDRYEGYNNAAAIELQRGNLSKAEEYLLKANELGAGKPEVLNNMGALELKRKDFTKAEAYFADARRLGANVDNNLGIIMINKGDYSRALTYFGDKTCKHNVALAHLLSGNIEGANQNAKCAPEHAETFYLLAVIGARANDSQAVISNLGKAIAADSAMKNIARNDREFLKFFENPEFNALVQ
jgi:tetratricopeptide (TPR) repeat protein